MTQDKLASIRLKVIAPDKLLIDDQVQEVSLPGLDGYLGILPGHRPLVVALGRGVIMYNRGHKKRKLSCPWRICRNPSGKNHCFYGIRKK